MTYILQHARKVTATAQASGALVPIDTDYCVVTDKNIDFVVRIAKNLDRRKQASTIKSPTASQNPFLPYEQALWVADIGEHHAVLLNKFNVIDNHLLIVTRHYEHQDRLLTSQDLSAIAELITKHGGLGFYNGGAMAGASQHHKHLQWIPGVELHGKLCIPMEPHLVQGNTGEAIVTTSPFPAAIAYIGSDRPLAQQYIDNYRALTRELGIDNGGEQAALPYNLLLSKSHLWIVPRVAECFESISLNAMAFAGSLFVKNMEQLDLLKNAGPLAALRSTSSLNVNR